jgi:hypothetical protein
MIIVGFTFHNYIRQTRHAGCMKSAGKRNLDVDLRFCLTANMLTLRQSLAKKHCVE